VESQDKTYFKEYTKDQLLGKINEEPLLECIDLLSEKGGLNVYITSVDLEHIYS